MCFFLNFVDRLYIPPKTMTITLCYYGRNRAPSRALAIEPTLGLFGLSLAGSQVEKRITWSARLGKESGAARPFFTAPADVNFINSSTHSWG